MQTQYFRGHFDDELWPAVASGNRTVEAQVGRKWVRVREEVRWPTNRRRISKQVWEALHLEPRPRPEHLDIKI